MRGCFKFFCFLFLLSRCFYADAEPVFTVGGVISGKNNIPVSGATVFLSNTQQITITDDAGRFRLSKLTAGSFQLVVKMIGYAIYSGNIIVQHNIPDLKISLSELPVDLSEVYIKGKDPNWSDKLNIFKDNFLGLTKNGRNCTIANPHVLKLWWDKGILKGASNDFLIVENAELGYRLKYLLKAFEYRSRIGVTNYDGEVHFEEMTGTDKQQKQWAKNRLQTYQGSLMHFLRATYSGKNGPAHEGFYVWQVVKLPNDAELTGLNQRMRQPVVAEGRPIAFDTVASVIDSNFISLKFKSAFLVYYFPRKRALKKASTVGKSDLISMKMNANSSVLQLALKEAIVDSRGSFTNYRAFLMRGHWGDTRVGDQLPFEYQP